MDSIKAQCWHDREKQQVEAEIRKLTVKEEDLRQDTIQVEEKLDELEDFLSDNRDKMPTVVSKAIRTEEETRTEELEDLSHTRSQLKREMLSLFAILQDLSEAGKEDGCSCMAGK